jgi:hypothetical protein
LGADFADFVCRYQEGLDKFLFFPSLHDKKFFFSDSVLSIAINSGIYKKFTTPRKSIKMVGLQKSTENAPERICCPILKGC